MGDDYDREAKRWKSSWEHEYEQMKLAELDPNNAEDLKAYRQEHGRPDSFTVNRKKTIKKFKKKSSQKIRGWMG